VLPLALVLAIGLGLVGLAVATAVACALLPEPRIDTATRGALTTLRWASVDPNEAARAAGSWG
jgi:hypothetical protein